jgi:alkylation response protein AidB-like acyl-CoA dehydrogenase
MDFGLSEEQTLLDDSLRRFLAERVPTTRVRELLETPDAHDAKLWSELAELGVAGCLVAEEHGGAGLSLLDAAVIATALGHAAAPTPFLGSAILAPRLIAGAASDAQRKEWLPKLAAGKLRLGVAIAEQVERRDDAGVALDAGKLRGIALFAIDGVGADAYLVAAGEIPSEAPLLALHAKSHLADVAMDVVRIATQVHGGIGFTDAYDLQLWFKRVSLARQLLGTPNKLRARAAALQGL